MEYRGYRASVEFDGEIYFGKLVDVDDLVTFESDTPGNLEREFHAAVDDYIEFRQSLTATAHAG